MAQERLGGHIGDRRPLLEAVSAELVGEVEDELVGGAEAAGALGGGHHHRPGVGQQPLPAVGGRQGARQGGDGMGRAAGAGPGDGGEVLQVAGGDHQVVEAVAAVGGLDLLVLGVDPGGLGVDELDPVGLEGRGDREGDVGGVALAEGDPDEGGVEDEAVVLGDHGDLDVVLQLVLDGQGGGQAGEVGPKYQDLGSHGGPPCVTLPVRSLSR